MLLVNSRLPSLDQIRPQGYAGGNVTSIDETFFVPRQSVSVVSIKDDSEALLVRAILENLGAAVTLHLPGAPSDFLQVLAQRVQTPRYLVICAHGTDDGFVFGDYAPNIDTKMLVRGCLPSSALDGHVALPGSTVVSTACRTGTGSFGAAFRGGAAAAYIAPRGSPDGADAALFVHRLFDQLLRKKAPLQQALERANADDNSDEAFATF